MEELGVEVRLPQIFQYRYVATWRGASGTDGYETVELDLSPSNPIN
jgi:hypothetical protein